jgi:MFS superfamily sulfate permease-like transporter
MLGRAYWPIRRLVVGGNRYDRSELAGAFGDLGTLVPFVVGYVTINRLDPQAVLLGFGLVALATGLYFRTPMPVQPMKAIATVAVTQAAIVTPAMIWVSGLVTGVFWLAMAITGAVSWVAALTSRPVVRGLVVGLGLSFILEGVNLMQRGPALAIAGAALTFLLLSQSRLPAMLVLLIYGALAALITDRNLMSDLTALSPGFRLPSIGLPSLGLRDVVQGTLVLALPQAALTLGNAIIATKEENNALFPDCPVSVRLLAADHGVMNLLGAVLGGVPMCRGAGGMAGHIRFGARTGGALVILGALLLVVALFLSDSVDTLFRLFPMPVLCVILFFGGIELAASANGDGASRPDRIVMVATAGIALWNMGAGYGTGLLLHHAAKRGFVRL